MSEMIDTITTIENYLNQDPLVKITEKLGCGDLYKKAVLNDLVKSPDVQIDDTILTIHESYSKESVYKNLKNMGYETLDTLRYIASHPKDFGNISYTVAKEIITNPKVLATTILGIAVLGAGCISQPSDSSSNDADLPIPTPTNEKVMKTTPDGMTFYGSPNSNDNKYLPAYDTDGDGDIDAKDSAVNQPMADQYNNGDIKKTIKGFFGIPIDSKLHQNYPDIKEFRIRKWDLDGDKIFKEKVEILINGKIIYSTTTDTNNNSGIDILDVMTDLDWQ